MTNLTTTGAQSRTITAFFDRHEAAAKASNDMIALGIPSGQVRLTEGNNAKAAPVEANAPDKSFWEQIKDLFLPAEDRYSYAEGLRRGGYLVSVQVDNAIHDQVVRVLDSDGAVDMDEREESWRASGWTGYEAGYETGEKNPPPRSPQEITTPSEALPTFDEGAVWRRDTSHGRARFRSYMYDAPGVTDEPANRNFTSSTGQIEDHMDVIASDGVKIGTVDHLDGERIKLAKSTSPDGLHHFVSLADVDHVDTHVHLNRTSSDVKADWLE